MKTNNAIETNAFETYGVSRLKAESPASARARIAERRKIDVVLVEDDRDFRSLLTSSLYRAGFRVTALRDGLEAADYIASRTLSSRRPDIVVSDIRLPGYDGLELLKAIRESNWTIPVILMSGFPRAELERAALAYDVTALLSKPFQLRELTEAIIKETGEHTAPVLNGGWA